jgi:hypothetical protein
VIAGSSRRAGRRRQPLAQSMAVLRMHVHASASMQGLHENSPWHSAAGSRARTCAAMAPRYPSKPSWQPTAARLLAMSASAANAAPRSPVVAVTVCACVRVCGKGGAVAPGAKRAAHQRSDGALRLSSWVAGGCCTARRTAGQARPQHSAARDPTQRTRVLDDGQQVLDALQEVVLRKALGRKRRQAWQQPDDRPACCAIAPLGTCCAAQGEES